MAGGININLNALAAGGYDRALYSKKDGANRPVSLRALNPNSAVALSGSAKVERTPDYGFGSGRANAEYHKMLKQQECDRRNIEIMRKNREEAEKKALAASTKRKDDGGSTKELDYDPKKYSKKIMRSKSSANAKLIASQIRAEISGLYDKLKSGEYDVNEVMSAIVHAEAMEQAALRRADNLYTEEQAKRSMDRKERIEETGVSPTALEPSDDLKKQIEEDMKAELEEEMKAMLKELEEEFSEMMQEVEEVESFYDALDELNKALSGDMEPEDLEAMKKRHRAEENGIINLADMEFLKAKFQRLQAQKNAIASGALSVSPQGASAPAPVFSGASFSVSVSAPSVTYSPAASGSASVPHIAVSAAPVSGGSVDISG